MQILDHHIQKSIVYSLVVEEPLKFSQLKPAEIESKLFTYHLKKAITAGYIKKDESGLYSLTPEGRRLGSRVLKQEKAYINQPHSVLFLVIRRKSDGAWLLYERNVQPLKGLVGFMHCIPEPEVSILETASRICKEKTNLTCNFKSLGGGYFRTFKNKELESFTHFSLLICDDATGELMVEHERADYSWQLEPNFNDPKMLPNMPTLIEFYNKQQPFFIEKDFKLD